MKNMKKYFAAAMSAAMVAGLAVVPTQAEEAKGSVYYLNFKPEQATQWEDLAKIYTEQTGVEVNVLTAASGTYESTLKSEMAKDRSSDPVSGKRTGWSGNMERLLPGSERQ